MVVTELAGARLELIVDEKSRTYPARFDLTPLAAVG
jgi:hypothetical protein